MSGPWERYRRDETEQTAGPWSRYQQAAQTPPRAGAASEAVSGFNEGVARTLGTPVDLVDMAVGAGMAGINRLAGTNFQRHPEPFLGSRHLSGLMEDGGMIRPPSDDKGDQFIRRVGEEVGATLVPGLGVAGRASRPAQSAAGTLALGATAGVGGATANQLFPENDTADLVGTMVGGIAPYSMIGGARRAGARRAAEEAVPTTEQLRARSSTLYEEGADTGRTASQLETQAMSRSMRDVAVTEGLIDPTGAVDQTLPRISRVLDVMERYGEGEMTARQALSVRRTLQRAAQSTDPAESRIGTLMLREFDQHADRLVPQFEEARQLWSRASRAGQLETLGDVADSNTSQFTQSGAENALRSQYRTLDRSIARGRERGFSPGEVDAIKRVSRGTVAGNVARDVGRFAPHGPVSAAASVGLPAIAGTSIGGPLGGIAAAMGSAALTQGARSVATNMTKRNAQLAELLVRNGMPVERVQRLRPDEWTALHAMFGAQFGLATGQEAEQ